MDKYLMDSSKLLWHMDRVIDHFEKGKRVYPIHIDLGATSTCNANCVYCFAKHQKKLGEVMDWDIFVKFMTDAPKLGVKSVAIIGDGEPTLNPALYKAVEVGNSNGLDISVGTNGILLTPEKIDILLANCVWIRFNLSAIGNKYKDIHGVDKWDTVKNNIETAVNIKKDKGYKCTIGLQMVLVPECLDQVIPESKFAVDSGVDYFVIKQYSVPGCKEMSQVDMKFYNQVDGVLKEAELMSTNETQIIPKWGIIHMNQSDKPYKSCVDLPLLIECSGTGKLYPCGYHFRNEKYCLGDLNKQSFQEIVESEHYWSLISSIRNNLVVGKDCKGACRHDKTNEFLNRYIKKTEHINFI